MEELKYSNEWLATSEDIDNLIIEFNFTDKRNRFAIQNNNTNKKKK